MPATPNPPSSEPDDETAGRLLLAILRLARRLRQEAPEGITPSQLSAVSIVASVGPLTIGELAEHENIAAPTVSRIVTSLEASGRVERIADPSDRRVSRLRATTKAQARAGPGPGRAQRVPRRTAPDPRRRRARRRAGRPSRPRAPRHRRAPMSAVKRGARTTFASLGVRNYRLFFVSQVVSVTGTWMQMVAQSWLVLNITGSARGARRRHRLPVPADAASSVPTPASSPTASTSASS